MSGIDPARPLAGRSALVTGVSRRRGIGYAVASRLIDLGATVVAHHFAPHDADQPWGADDVDEVLGSLRERAGDPARVHDVHADLADPDAPERVVARATELAGRLHVLVANHARSGGDGALVDLDAAALDGHWAVNARATLLLTRAFATRFSGRTRAAGAAPGERLGREVPLDEHDTGRVIWMTSGQLHGPMHGEVAYAASKAALAGITPTVAAELLDHGVLLNTVDPGPVNTGYLDPETTDRPLADLERAFAAMPFGRAGAPTDPARLIGWLVTDHARWVVGQVLSSDGGFRLG